MEAGKRRHRFFDRYTKISAVVLVFAGILVAQALGELIGMPLTVLAEDDYIGGGIGTAVISFVLLGLYKFWFRPEFEGNLRGGDLKLGFKLMLIFVVYWAISTPLGFLITHNDFGAPTLTTICMSIMAGTSEEVAFRGLPISYLMRQWRKEKHILATVIFTAILFAAIHLINVLAGGNPEGVVIQVLGSLGIGIILAAIYLRCGNLLITMIIHTVHDIIAFTDITSTNNGLVATGLGVQSILDIGFSVILAVIGFWLIRPAKRGEIRALWDRKWRMDQEDRSADFDERSASLDEMSASLDEMSASPDERSIANE